MASLFALKGAGSGLSLIGATPSFWVGCLTAFSSSLEPPPLTRPELKLGCSIRLPKFFLISLASPLSLKTKGVLGPYCFTPPCSLSKGLIVAFHGYRDLFRSTGRPDSECKFLLNEPARFGTTVDGMPAYDMRSSFTKDLTAQLEQKTSRLNWNKLGPRVLTPMFVRVPSISAFALSPSPNWRT
jgi:hypothetical protein